MKAFRSIVNRMKEPSTWAGLAGLASVFGVSQPDFQAVAAGVTGLASLAAMALKDPGSAE
ncbi:MAG: hypothetical protein HQL39_20440 [Alphaproteobacteria bacterium]|nr:hypothetical protein [Alphaproteobacteria bacterium]MBF0375764.1 hypothetical protein [Alphaproteobacteria bacterium]